MNWDLYSQQPLALHHPALRGFADCVIAVTAVSRVRRGIIWWKADSWTPGGMPGSGFTENPIAGIPWFDEARNAWMVAPRNEPEWEYCFCLPDASMLRQWDIFSQGIPSAEKLQATALQTYPKGV